MKGFRKRELFELVKVLADTFGPGDIALLVGRSASYVHRIANAQGINFRPAPPNEVIEKMDPFMAKRCEDFRSGKLSCVVMSQDRQQNGTIVLAKQFA